MSRSMGPYTLKAYPKPLTGMGGDLARASVFFWQSLAISYSLVFRDTPCRDDRNPFYSLYILKVCGENPFLRNSHVPYGLSLKHPEY